MRKVLLGLIPLFAGLLLGIAGTMYWFGLKPAEFSPLGDGAGSVLTRPLDKYTVDALSKTAFDASPIVFGEPTATASAYTVRPFSYRLGTKTVTGVAHIPTSPLTPKMPVIVQFRGFVDHAIYSPGVGTAHSAEAFAKAGFLSLAPDFLGYGGSDMPSTDVFEDRFETYTAALELVSSVGSIPFADAGHVFLWGHSNGGHIALTVLTVTGKPMPTVLWAPVTKPFPYSILYYTDDADDLGRSLRKELAKFEVRYDTDRYSFTNYLDRITAPMQFQQGTADTAVPTAWTSGFVDTLKTKGKTAALYTYPGADHNLNDNADAWNMAVSRDIQFFKSYLQ
jgi:dipeptidyl aminopeptidase/acylaminoacyl peptidase